MAYTIQIDEAQRLLLLRIFHAARSNDNLVESLTAEPGHMWNMAFEEFQTFHAMLTTLPENEQDSPGVLHGFCL